MEFRITEKEARAMARLEEEAGCDVSAGPDYGARLGDLMANPGYFLAIERLQEVVVRELRGLLGELNLGAGLDEAFVCARRIVMGRLVKPEVEIQDRLWVVLEDEDRQKPEVRRVLSEVMTEADWEAMVCDRP